MQIEFLHHNLSIIKNFSPYPAKKSPPDWFKKLPQTISSVDGTKATAKNCIPLQDVINAGYIIPNAYEVDLKTKIIHNDKFQLEINKPKLARIGFHHFEQCPIHNQEGKIDFFKLFLDWKIKTPAGYSCLIFDPFYRESKPYQILPGIVDTDTYDIPINFIGKVNSHEIITIPPGEPIVQVIPFKRDDWNMKTSLDESEEGLLHFFNATTTHARRLYRSIFHSKKKFD